MKMRRGWLISHTDGTEVILTDAEYNPLRNTRWIKHIESGWSSWRISRTFILR